MIRAKPKSQFHLNQEIYLVKVAILKNLVGVIVLLKNWDFPNIYEKVKGKRLLVTLSNSLIAVS